MSGFPAPSFLPATEGAALGLDGQWLVRVHGQVRGDRASVALRLRRDGAEPGGLLAGDLDRPGVPRLAVDALGRVVVTIRDQVEALTAGLGLEVGAWEDVVLRYDRPRGLVALTVGGVTATAAIPVPEVGIDLDTVTIGGPRVVPGYGAFQGAIAGLRFADRWWTEAEADAPFDQPVDAATTGWWAFDGCTPGHLPGRWRLPSRISARQDAANAIRLDSVDGGGGSCGTVGAFILAARLAQPAPVLSIDAAARAALGVTDPRRASFDDRPAWSWEGALPSGNGDQGVMLLGRPEDDVVVLNQAGLFLPLHPPIDPPRQADLLPAIREDLVAGRFQGAADRVVEQSFADGYTQEKRWTDPFIPAAFLRIWQPAEGPVRGYLRGTDYRDGTVAATWEDDHGPHRRRVVASRADGVVANHLTSPAGTLTARLTLARHDAEAALDGEQPTAPLGPWEERVEGDLLICRQEYRHRWPGSLRAAVTVARVVAIGGTLRPATDGLHLQGADAALILVRTALERDGDDPQAIVAGLRQGLAALDGNPEACWRRHRALHQPLMEACRLDLGGSEEGHATTGTALFGRAAVGMADPVLLEKAFQACRHLTVCSSGSRFPPTLQGIWGGSWRPSWSGDYTQNGNLQTAISGHLDGGLGTLLEGFFAYQESLLPDYRRNAQVLYGARGLLVPSRTSSHGRLNHFDGTWPMTFWTAGAAWNARFFMDAWLHHGDRTFLVERALPFMLETAAFYEDFLAGSGTARFMPSYSPENDSPATGSQSTVDAAMDVAAARQVLEDLLALESEGIITAEEALRWRTLRDRLPPFRIGEGGVLAEWGDPRLSERHEHRHASQLYAFYEGLPAWAENDGALLAAARATVHARMAHRRRAGGGIMAFGMVQLGCAAASLGMAEDAGDIIDWLANRFFFPETMVTAHNPRHVLNTDIAGGLPRLMLLALVDHRPGLLRLLPALPPAWPQGRVEGICCRGQVEVRSLTWNAEVLDLELCSAVAQTLHLRVADHEAGSVDLAAGVPRRLRLRRDGTPVPSTGRLARMAMSTAMSLLAVTVLPAADLPIDFLDHAGDYVHACNEEGLYRLDIDNNRDDWGYTGVRNTRLTVISNRYAMNFDQRTFSLMGLAPVVAPLSESDALERDLAPQGNQVFGALAGVVPADAAFSGLGLAFTVVRDGVRWKVAGRANRLRSQQAINVGRYLQQRFYRDPVITSGTLVDDSKATNGQAAPLNTFNMVTSGLEMCAWTDRVSWILRMKPNRDLAAAGLEATFTYPVARFPGVRRSADGSAVALTTAGGQGLVVLAPEGVLTLNATTGTITAEAAVRAWAATEDRALGLAVIPRIAVSAADLEALVAAERQAPTVEVRRIGADLGPAPGYVPKRALEPGLAASKIRLNRLRGVVEVDEPTYSRPTGQIIHAWQEYQVRVTNPDPGPRTVRLNLRNVGVGPEHGDIGHASLITGGVAQVTEDPLDTAGASDIRVAGLPLGLPVQIGKNWHSLGTKDPIPDRFRGNWIHRLVMVQVPGGATRSFRLSQWYHLAGGPVAAASHAHLCTIGYKNTVNGVVPAGQEVYGKAPDQQWDEAALGSFGEAVTFGVGNEKYHQDQTFANDVREVFSDANFGGNVGGFGLLTYSSPETFRDSNGTARTERRHSLVQQKTAWRKEGPHQTEVTYHARSDDRRLSLAATVRLNRTDDVVRLGMSLDYRVEGSDPLPVRRLSFLRLGTDSYNYGIFTKAAHGSSAGVVAEWEVLKALNTVRVATVGADGVSWFSLHGLGAWAGSTDPARASRGLVVRSWRGVLGGVAVDRPTFRLVGDTEYNTGSARNTALLEFIPPVAATTLKAGDHLTIEADLLIFPSSVGGTVNGRPFVFNYKGADLRGSSVVRASTVPNGWNAGFAEAMADGADTFAPVLREARDNQPRATPRSGTTLVTEYPLTLRTEDGATAALRLAGGLAWMPLTVTGFRSHRVPGIEMQDAQGAWTPVPGAGLVQARYEPTGTNDIGTWTMTWSIPRDGQAPEGQEYRVGLPDTSQPLTLTRSAQALPSTLVVP